MVKINYNRICLSKIPFIICFKIAFNDKYADEYEALVQQGNVKSLPIEYYDIIWTTFARDVITTRSIPYKSSLIDSSKYRYQSGNDK